MRRRIKSTHNDYGRLIIALLATADVSITTGSDSDTLRGSSGHSDSRCQGDVGLPGVRGPGGRRPAGWLE